MIKLVVNKKVVAEPKVVTFVTRVHGRESPSTFASVKITEDILDRLEWCLGLFKGGRAKSVEPAIEFDSRLGGSINKSVMSSTAILRFDGLYLLFAVNLDPFEFESDPLSVTYLREKWGGTNDGGVVYADPQLEVAYERELTDVFSESKDIEVLLGLATLLKSAQTPMSAGISKFSLAAGFSFSINSEEHELTQAMRDYLRFYGVHVESHPDLTPVGLVLSGIQQSTSHNPCRFNQLSHAEFSTL
jgi:hypothetical protein